MKILAHFFSFTCRMMQGSTLAIAVGFAAFLLVSNTPWTLSTAGSAAIILTTCGVFLIASGLLRQLVVQPPETVAHWSEANTLKIAEGRTEKWLGWLAGMAQTAWFAFIIAGANR